MKKQQEFALIQPEAPSSEKQTPVQIPKNTPSNAPTNQPTSIIDDINLWHPPKTLKRPASLMTHYKEQYAKLVRQRSAQIQEQIPIILQEPEPSSQERAYTHPIDLEQRAAQTYSNVPDPFLQQLCYLHEVEHWPFQAIAIKYSSSPEQLHSIYQTHKNQVPISQRSKLEC